MDRADMTITRRGWATIAVAALGILLFVAALFSATWVGSWLALTVVLLTVFLAVSITLDGLAEVIAWWRVRRDARRRNPFNQGYQAHYDPLGTGKIERKGRGDE